MMGSNKKESDLCKLNWTQLITIMMTLTTKVEKRMVMIMMMKLAMEMVLEL